MGAADLSPTSALVLLMAGSDIHASPASKTYLRQLRLDAGRDLYAECMRIWPHNREVIRNRKHCILRLAINTVLEELTHQVVIMGAGADPLSLELCSAHGDCKVFEIDSSGMGEKSDLLRRTAPGLAGRISCIAADVSEPCGVMDGLVASGWDPNAPSLVIAEGISYYLPASKLWKTLGMFSTKDHDNHVILEYLIPNYMIAEGRAGIPERVFGTIASSCGMGGKTGGIVRYSGREVDEWICKIGGRQIKSYDMREMELDRTGESLYFGEDRSGWIEVCHFVLRDMQGK